MLASPRDAGVRDLPLAAPLLRSRRRTVLRRGAGERPLDVARRRRAARSARAARARAASRGGFGVAAARAARRLVRGLVAWSMAARRLVGVREPRARLSALRAARALARRPRAASSRSGSRRSSARSWSGRSSARSFPPLCDYGGDRSARLRGPVGLWNQLALLGRLRARRSRSGSRPRAATLARLRLAGRARCSPTRAAASSGACSSSPPGSSLATSGSRAARARSPRAARRASSVGIAFALPGRHDRRPALATAGATGSIFGVAARRRRCSCPGARRGCRGPRDTPRLRRRLHRAGGVVVAAVAVVRPSLVVARASRARAAVGERRRAGSRSTSSNFRCAWWQQAWHGFEHHQLAGTGAGSFELTNLCTGRAPRLDDRAAQPAAAVPRRDGHRRRSCCSSSRRVALLRGSLRRRGPELALALAAARVPPPRARRHRLGLRRRRGPGVPRRGRARGRRRERRGARLRGCCAAPGARCSRFGSLLLPWLGGRWADRRSLASPRARVTLANRAHAVDPLLVEPFWTRPSRPSSRQAAARVRLLRRRGAPRSRGTRRRGSRGRVRFSQRCPTQRVRRPRALHRARPEAPGVEGGDDYNDGARQVVNAARELLAER